MADAAGASFAVVDHMNVMEILAAVAEAGVNCGIGKSEEVFFMATQAGSINPFLVRRINLGGIASMEHPEVIGTMWVMASFAFSHPDRTM